LRHTWVVRKAFPRIKGSFKAKTQNLVEFEPHITNNDTFRDGDTTTIKGVVMEKYLNNSCNILKVLVLAR